MEAISRLRFEALAGYSRRPETILMSEEIGWFAETDERVLGVLIRDREDDDYGSIILGCDRKGRYRAVHVMNFFANEAEAQENLVAELADYAKRDETEFHQGDEVGRPLDFFSPVVPEERLNPLFRSLAFQEGYSPAREIMRVMMHYYEDPDGNFVEQFQTTGFDARIWELCLFASFVELGWTIDRSQPVPDFSCFGFGDELCVEATTVNPTKVGGVAVEPPTTQSPEEHMEFLEGYMAIKFGSALYSKLQKEYWIRENVTGKPLVFAIQDFHSPGSMVWTGSALPMYLYGLRHTPRWNDSGELELIAERIDTHRYGDKEIPSGFFFQEGAEHVSGVLFSNSGTISKFNRMGFLAGFGSRRVQMIRRGTCVNHDPNTVMPKVFALKVNDPNYSESWNEGLSMFHNPRAVNPIPEDFLPGIAHHRLEGDQVLSRTPAFHPLGSNTLILMAD